MNFTFNNEHYLQMGGTAMGTGVAPNYANIFMDRFETRAMDNWPDKPLIWLRFIDDIFMVWTHGETKLQKFITYLNDIHPSIKFTHEASKTSVNFLDTTVKIDTDNTLYTTLYEKPTDTHLYLHHSSAHHKPCLTKAPYGQFFRLRRICAKTDDYLLHSANLIKYYLNRDYLLEPLISHFERASKSSQKRTTYP